MKDNPNSCFLIWYNDVNPNTLSPICTLQRVWNRDFDYHGSRVFNFKQYGEETEQRSPERYSHSFEKSRSLQ